MPIGMFSRASLVSVKALRSYHELGILVPAEIDQETNYRSYRVSQLTDAAIVRRLRDLDLPLKDIAQIVKARDPQITHKIIAEHEREMRERLRDVARIVNELQTTLSQPSLGTPVHVRDEPTLHALSVSDLVKDGNYAAFLNKAFASIYSAAQDSGAIPAGPGSARYPPDVASEDEPVEAYTAIAEPVPMPDTAQAAGVVVALIPSERCAVATHVGGYDTIAETYAQLGAWVSRNAIPAERPIREHYIVSTDPATLTLLPQEELRTEICWPINGLISNNSPNTESSPT